MNIVMPMAGKGTRFKEAGYDVPKPFIPVHGVAIYRKALSDFYANGDQVIVITQEDHQPHFEAEPNYAIQPKKVFLTEVTEGAACSVLKARAFIDNEEPLLIVNCDQLIEFNRFNWAALCNNSDVDGVIFTFEASGSKWSYARLNQRLQVEQVAEKVEISPYATCGAYWFRHGYMFVEAADRMISRDIRTNNEFYVAPVFNQMIEMGSLVLPFMVDEMVSLGTPELLNDYLAVKRIYQ